MKLRDTIFDSNSEAKIFRALRSHWSPKLTLYPSLPLSKIVQVDPREMTHRELEYFYKTNVDYTFCQANGRPILSIEFDGIGGGFSRDGIYIQTRETSDPNRKLKMDLKLKVVKNIGYPLVVISYEEIKQFDAEDSLTVLDGIIGQVLAWQRFQESIKEMVEEKKPQIEELQGFEREEYIQDLVFQAEVEAKLESDPFAIKAAKYQTACSQHGISSYSIEYLSDPPLPEIKDFFDIYGLKARIEAMKHTVRAGCRIVIKIQKRVIAQPVVWVRNFEGFGIFPHSIAENIAKYLAFKEAYSLFVGRMGDFR